MFLIGPYLTQQGNMVSLFSYGPTSFTFSSASDEGKDGLLPCAMWYFSDAGSESFSFLKQLVFCENVHTTKVNSEHRTHFARACTG